MTSKAPLALIPPLLLAAAVGWAAEPSAEDDLALVRRATSTVRERRLPEKPVRAVEAPKARRSPTWLKLRIEEKGAKGARIAISLPLNLVRAVGDWPLGEHYRCSGRKSDVCSMRLSRALEALEAGQELVQIEDGDAATIRIWLE
jgi:hypothetical protein